MWKDATRLI